MTSCQRARDQLSACSPGTSSHFFLPLHSHNDLPYPKPPSLSTHIILLLFIHLFIYFSTEYLRAQKDKLNKYLKRWFHYAFCRAVFSAILGKGRWEKEQLMVATYIELRLKWYVFFFSELHAWWTHNTHRINICQSQKGCRICEIINVTLARSKNH